MKKLIVTMIMGLAINQAHAYEVKNVCVKYETNYSWSKSYSVRANIYRGDELNQAVGSFNMFNTWNYYTIIWWDQGQASIIKMDIYTPGMHLFLAQGVDQNGRHWEISDNYNRFCI